MQTITLEQIINEEKDIIPFLKSLNSKDKKELWPKLKKIKSSVYEFCEKKRRTICHFNDAQLFLIDVASFVICNRKNFNKITYTTDFGSEFFENEILPWYVPIWYSDYINNEKKIRYDRVLELNKKGFLYPTRSLIANCLARVYDDDLFDYPETLEDHIWYLFQEETIISQRYSFVFDDRKNRRWIDIFTKLVNDKHIKREKVITHTLLTFTSGFNKTNTGWFTDLLLSFEITKEEVLSLQEEIFTALDTQHSKPINILLKYIKNIVSEEEFQRDLFIQNAGILIISETKAVVNITIQVLEKIIRQKATEKLDLIKIITEGLIQTDEKIQLKIAKLIVKYGDPLDESLKDQISIYQESLYFSVKEVLSSFLIEEETEEEVEKKSYISILSEENKIPVYSTFDEILFLVAQAVENNEVYHVELLLNYLPKLDQLITNENVSKLEPVFKRALDVHISRTWTKNIGALEINYIPCYLNEYADILMARYPDRLQKYKLYRTKKDIGDKLKYFEETNKINFPLGVYYQLILYSRQLLKRNQEVDFLSTPTHAPCWIAPQILIDRILSLDEKGVTINLIDFQIAIGRLPVQDYKGKFTSLIQKIKHKEIKEVLNYHFSEKELQSQTIDRPELWLQSVISRSIQEEITFLENKLNTNFDRERGIYKRKFKSEIPKSHNYYNVILFLENKVVNDFDGIFKREYLTSLFNEYIHHNDDMKVLFLHPNNYKILLSKAVNSFYLGGTILPEVPEQTFELDYLKSLENIWYREEKYDTPYRVLIGGILNPGNVHRDLSVEIWLSLNDKGIIDNKRFGAIVGELQARGYAPFKRFTDLIVKRMLNISKKHNENLLEVLVSMIENMPSTPIRGIKKVLELILELRTPYLNYNFPEKTKEVFESWKSTKSLKPILIKLTSSDF